MLKDVAKIVVGVVRGEVDRELIGELIDGLTCVQQSGLEVDAKRSALGLAHDLLGLGKGPAMTRGLLPRNRAVS